MVPALGPPTELPTLLVILIGEVYFTPIATPMRGVFGLSSAGRVVSVTSRFLPSRVIVRVTSSPGLRSDTILTASAAVVTANLSTALIRSPDLSLPVAALPLATDSTRGTPVTLYP